MSVMTSIEAHTSMNSLLNFWMMLQRTTLQTMQTFATHKIATHIIATHMIAAHIIADSSNHSCVCQPLSFVNILKIKHSFNGFNLALH